MLSIFLFIQEHFGFPLLEILAKKIEERRTSPKCFFYIVPELQKMVGKCNHITGAKGEKSVEKAFSKCTDRAWRHVACLALESRTQEERVCVEEISIAY